MWGWSTLSRVAPALVASAALAPLPAAAAIDVDALWDYGKPELSEQRFNAAMAGASEDERLMLQTQIARTHGLRRDFAKARAVLAQVEPSLPKASPEVRTRHALELGRTYASGTHDKPPPADLEAARKHFTRAFEVAAAARLDALAIDALHMMVFVDTAPDQQLQWNRRALEVLERSTQPAARRWEGALRNNLGHALHEKRDYEGAIAEFKLSRAAYERDGRVRGVRIADWMIAHTLRAQGKLREALAIQERLEREWEAAGQSDPYVFEELEHLHRALGDEAKARQYRERRDKGR
jgi:tetratricopeptide (TPR) repeat protein